MTSILQIFPNTYFAAEFKSVDRLLVTMHKVVAEDSRKLIVQAASHNCKKKAPTKRSECYLQLQLSLAAKH